MIVIENLNVSGMTKNRKLARGVLDASFGEIRRQFEYKCGWIGIKLKVVDRFYPSSQLCSDCGYQNKRLKDLSIREWICPNCGSIHDRDFNASLNLRNEGMKELSV
jgi:putative transposase